MGYEYDDIGFEKCSIFDISEQCLNSDLVYASIYYIDL